MADVDVTLGLNANQLHSELTDVKSKLSGFASALTGLGAGFLSGIGSAQIQQAVTDALHYGSTIQDLSEKFGVSAETIQRFGNVAEKNGSSLEGVAKAFGFLEKNREKALAAPSGAQADAFAGLGISIADLESMKAEDIMFKIGQSSLNAADLVGVLGKSALDLRTTLAQIADFGFDKTPIVSNEDIARVDAFDDGLKTVEQTLKAMTVTLLGELIPALVQTGGFFAKITGVSGAVDVSEAITRAGDKTPIGAAAAPEDTALVQQLHAMRERQAGGALPPELAAAADIKAPEEKKKRRFGEAAGEADYSKEESKDKKKDEKDRIKESAEYEKKNLDDYYKDRKEETKDTKEKTKADEKLAKIDAEFAKNPAGVSLHEYATQGSGIAGAKARQIEQEEALAKQLQLQGNLGLAKEHQGRAEKLKKEIGLPSKEDQKDSVIAALDEAKVLQQIEKNTAKAGANK